MVAEIDRTNSQTADKIILTGGTATLGGTLIITNLGPTLVNDDTFDLFEGTVSGSFTTLNLPGGAAHWRTEDLNVNGTIRFTNASPVAQNLTLGVALGGSVSFSVIGGKYGATDADGDSLTVTGVSAASSGTSGYTANSVTYAATGNLGTNTFTYNMSDALGATDTKTVTVIVSDAQGFNQLSPPEVLGGGTVALSYLGIPGSNYALDWATNLTSPINWIPVVTNAAGPNGYLNFTNTSSEPLNFYRTRYVP